MWTSLLTYITPKVTFWGFIILSVLSTFLYVSYLRNRVAQLKNDAILLQTAVDQQKKTIDELRKDYENIIKAKEELSKKIEDSKKKINSEKSKLDKVGADTLEDAAIKNPIQVQIVLNEQIKRLIAEINATS